jgi:endo-1,4-beta-xylanase
MTQLVFASVLIVLITVTIPAQNRTPAYVLKADPISRPYADGTFENGMDKWNFWAFSPTLGNFSIVDTLAHSGKYCGRFKIDNIGSEIWHVQLQQKNFKITKNNIYKINFWARGDNGAGTLEVIFIKGSPPWTYYSGKRFKMTEEWKLCEMLFTATNTTTDIQMNFGCAGAKGNYYIDDVFITDAGSVDLKPVAPDWYERAEARIDSIRKGNFTISLLDNNGAPCKGVAEVHLVKHAFSWGTCINFAGGELETKYRKTILKHFNAAVFENAFKWEEYEQERGKPNIKRLDEYLKWGELNGIPIRGHALVWGIENYGYQNHWARLGDTKFLRDAIRDRIYRDVGFYKGKIREYDVWNEPVHESAHFNRVGLDILDSSFVWAHRADPAARLFINEYSIIEGGDSKPYRDMIDTLLARKVPVHGIGIQGHFSSAIDPLDIAAKLDYMAQTGLPIKITEFDINPTDMKMSAEVQASEYAKALRTCFSHPSIEGFYMWGFWDARHWRRGAGMYDVDFKPKPAADSVYNLIHRVWTTNDIIQSDDNGKLTFRGFYGDYEIIVKTASGKKKKVVVAFTKDGVQEQQISFQNK